RLFAPPHRIAQNPACHFLVRSVHGCNSTSGHALVFGLEAQDGVLDIFRDLLECLRLVMMGIHVDDQEVLMAAVKRLPPGIGKMLLGIEIVARWLDKMISRCESHAL